MKNKFHINGMCGLLTFVPEWAINENYHLLHCNGNPNDFVVGCQWCDNKHAVQHWYDVTITYARMKEGREPVEER